MRLDRSNIGNDTIRLQVRQYFPEGINRMIQCHTIDHQFRSKVLHFLHLLHPDCIINKAHPFRIFFQNSDFMVKAKQIRKERAHFPGS